MQVFLNDRAWKASESSYMLETVSSDISLNEKRRNNPTSIPEIEGAKTFEITFLAHLCNGILAESLKSLQKILISSSK